jgi:hypothetical protein
MPLVPVSWNLQSPDTISHQSFSQCPRNGSSDASMQCQPVCRLWDDSRGPNSRTAYWRLRVPKFSPSIDPHKLGRPQLERRTGLRVLIRGPEDFAHRSYNLSGARRPCAEDQSPTMRRMVVSKFMALSRGAYHTPDRFPVEAAKTADGPGAHGVVPTHRPGCFGR